MALNRKRIAEQMQTQLGFQRNRSFEIIEILLEIIKSTLEAGEDVLVSGFGNFCVKDEAERKGRDSATGENLILPTRRVVTLSVLENSGKM